MGQKLEWSVAGQAHAIRSSYYDSPHYLTVIGQYLINTALLASGTTACISSRITTVIHVISFTK